MALYLVISIHTMNHAVWFGNENLPVERTENIPNERDKMYNSGVKST